MTDFRVSSNTAVTVSPFIEVEPEANTGLAWSTVEELVIWAPLIEKLISSGPVDISIAALPGAASTLGAV